MIAFFDDEALGQFTHESDVGTVQPPGQCVYDAAQQRYTIASAGQNIWGDHDDFHFVWKKLTGDFIVTAQVALLGAGVNPHRKLGWMARAGLDAQGPNVCTGIHGDGLLTLQYRRTSGGQTGEVRSPLKGADVVQLERRGDTYMMSVARFGEPLQMVQVDDLELGDELYVGLYVCSHEVDVVEQAAFDNVRIVVPVKAGFNRDADPFGSHLEILEIASGRREVIYSADHVIEAPNWTRDGQALIYNRGGRLYRFDLASRSSTPIDTGSVVRNNNDHVISFDGTLLAISSHSPEDHTSLIYTVPIGGGQPRQVTPVGPSYLHGWSADDQYLVYCAERRGDYDVYRIPVAGGEEVQLTTAPGLDDGPEYTPDGQYIYFNSVRSGRMQIWRMQPDGSDQEQLTDDEYNNWFAHIAPDGQQVIFVTYLVGEVEPSDHPAARRVYLRLMPRDGGAPCVVAYLYGGQGTMNVPSWSPDGLRVAFVSNTVPQA
jgi:TolB protein